MAQEIVLRCDGVGGKPCLRQAKAWRIWPEGAPAAYRIDLCDTHAKPLLAFISNAVPEDLPTKPRQAMTVTKLKTTKATRSLKK